MKISETNTLDSLAERSLKQQMLMVKMLRPLPMELETSSLETITKFNVNFRTLQQEIKITDKKLMQHLKTAYPYLFSLAMRTNPFNPDASVVVK